jgi:hypothetical protein
MCAGLLLGRFLPHTRAMLGRESHQGWTSIKLCHASHLKMSSLTPVIHTSSLFNISFFAKERTPIQHHDLCNMIARTHLCLPIQASQHFLSSLIRGSCSSPFYLHRAAAVANSRHHSKSYRFSHRLSIEGRRRQPQLIAHHHRTSLGDIRFAGKATSQRPHKLARQLPPLTHPP